MANPELKLNIDIQYKKTLKRVDKTLTKILDDQNNIMGWVILSGLFQIVLLLVIAGSVNG